MKTKYNDRFGKSISSGHTLRPFDGDIYGRPVIVRFRDNQFVIDIPEFEDGIPLDLYVEDARSSGWEYFEIVHPYPYAEPFREE